MKLLVKDFIYTNSMNRLNYFVGGEIVTVSHLDKICYILGYLPKENRVFLGDKEMNVISYSLLLSVMECIWNRLSKIAPRMSISGKNKRHCKVCADDLPYLFFSVVTLFPYFFLS